MFKFDFLSGYLVGFLLGIGSSSATWGFVHEQFRRTMNNRHKDTLNALIELRESSDERDRELAEFIAGFSTRPPAGQAESSQTERHPD